MLRIYFTLIVNICSTIIFTTFSTTANAQLESGKPDNFWQEVFEKNRVVDIKIRVSKENWSKMQPKGFRGSEYEYVEADLTVDGERLSKVGLRFKGNSSYRFSSHTLKRPMKIDTNRFVQGLKLHGRTKFNLSTSALDPAYMKEKLAYDLYKSAGLPTPGVGWANVKLEIEGLEEETNLGIYVLIEQVDDKFLRRTFGKDSKGSLLMKPEISSWRYLGDDPKSYSTFNIKSGEQDEEQIKKFAEVLRLIDQGSDEEFATEIGNKLDLNMLAGYLAATSLLANLDSFVAAPHNYFLVLDKSDGKLKLLPWDVNEAFGTFTFGKDPAVLTQWDISKPYITDHRVLNRLFETDYFPMLYRKKLAELIQTEFTAKRIGSQIHKFEKALLPHIQNKGLQELIGFQMGIDGDKTGLNVAVGRKVYAIQPFVKKRIESVKGQLEGKSKGQSIRGGFF